MYGPARVPTAFAMVVSAWAAGYFMVTFQDDFHADI
jgi:hypothetical protein